MEKIAETIVGWAYPALGLVMVVLACTRPRLRGRPLLLGFLIINLTAMILWRIPSLLVKLGAIDIESLSRIYARGGLLVNAFNLVGFCLLIPYLLVAGEPAARDPERYPNWEYERTNTMTISRALFSFRGRMCRSDYWLKGFLIMLPIGIFNNILAYGVDDDGARMVAMIIGILSLWPGLALIVKRLHDRDRSGWFVLTLFIPFANIIFAVWMLIEVWFVKGTDGPNRFGEDPVRPTGVLPGNGPHEDSAVTPSF